MILNDERLTMTKRITDFETYAEYVADRAAKKQDVVPESLFTALKEDETLCNVRAEGYEEFEASWKAFEVKDVSLRSDPTQPAYIVRTV